MKTFRICTCIAFLASASLAHEIETEHSGTIDSYLSVQPFVQYFQWKEFFRNGSSLKEDGPMPGVGVDYFTKLNDDLTLFTQGQFYFGNVDYDGHVTGPRGELIPYTSQTRYTGIQADTDIAYNLSSEDHFNALPFLGLGFRYWIRELDADGPTGYDEHWSSVHARAGMRLQWIRDPQNFWYVWGAVIMPLYNNEDVKGFPQATDHSIRLEPKRQSGVQAEAGYIQGNLIGALFYEALNFGESPPDSSGFFYQPKSKKQVIGLKAGFVF